MKLFTLCAIALIFSATSFDPAIRDTSIDVLCPSFIEWQRIMKSEGYQTEKYAKTGMEKFCPGMV